VALWRETGDSMGRWNQDWSRSEHDNDRMFDTEQPAKKITCHFGLGNMTYQLKPK